MKFRQDPGFSLCTVSSINIYNSQLSHLDVIQENAEKEKERSQAKDKGLNQRQLRQTTKYRPTCLLALDINQGILLIIHCIPFF